MRELHALEKIQLILGHSVHERDWTVGCQKFVQHIRMFYLCFILNGIVHTSKWILQQQGARQVTHAQYNTRIISFIKAKSFHKSVIITKMLFTILLKIEYTLKIQRNTFFCGFVSRHSLQEKRFKFHAREEYLNHFDILF